MSKTDSEAVEKPAKAPVKPKSKAVAKKATPKKTVVKKKTATPPAVEGDAPPTVEGAEGTVMGRPAMLHENAKQRAVYKYWVDNDMRVADTCAAFGIPVSTFQNWSKKWDWRERAEMQNAEAMAQLQLEEVEQRKERFDGQRRAALLMRNKATVALAQRDVSKMQDVDVLRMMKLGVEIEQKLDRLPDILAQVAKATPDELDKLIVHLENEREKAIQNGKYYALPSGEKDGLEDEADAIEGEVV